ncbi:MAG TPA: methyltransferase [Pirellulales bacterium]|nr:methyltransferase [Pirellulales bacterium]
MMNSLAYFTRPLATVAPRDLLLQQCLGAKASDAVLEVGTGSGSSLFRFADSVAAYHGIDISPGPVDRLRRAVARRRRPFPDIELFALDFCQPNAAAKLQRRYDLVFSCDTLEHVQDPQTFIHNVYAALKPGGRALITYPNEHPSYAHGITYFERRADVQQLFTNAGFSARDLQIDALQMTTAADRALTVGWRWPQGLAKAALRRLMTRQDRSAAPQTFDETDFFALADRLEPLAPLINAYCWLVLRAMGALGPAYRTVSAAETIWHTRLLIRAARPAAVIMKSRGMAEQELPSRSRLFGALPT